MPWIKGRSTYRNVKGVILDAAIIAILVAKLVEWVRHWWFE